MGAPGIVKKNRRIVIDAHNLEPDPEVVLPFKRNSATFYQSTAVESSHNSNDWNDNMRRRNQMMSSNAYESQQSSAGRIRHRWYQNPNFVN
jgi:hypothetical protein